MCGRFDFHGTLLDIDAAFGPVQHLVALPPPSYNIAPTLPAAVLTQQEGALALRVLTFGLKRRGGGLWVNARTESLTQKARVQPCAVLAHGFYEWQPQGKRKQPYYFTLPQAPIFALAALRHGDSFMILTCPPNALVAPIHGRMPVILDTRTLPLWLNHSLPTLAAYPAADMRKSAVSPAMNDPRHDGPACVAPFMPE